MPHSVRLDEESEAWVRREARRRHTSRSEIIRLALRRAAQEEGGEAPFPLIADLLGSWRSKSGALSERTGEWFARSLSARRR